MGLVLPAAAPTQLQPPRVPPPSSPAWSADVSANMTQEPKYVDAVGALSRGDTRARASEHLRR